MYVWLFVLFKFLENKSVVVNVIQRNLRMQNRRPHSKVASWIHSHLFCPHYFELLFPSSSADEPLKWQYVDQFVSDSGVSDQYFIKISSGKSVMVLKHFLLWPYHRSYCMYFYYAISCYMCSGRQGLLWYEIILESSDNERAGHKWNIFYLLIGTLFCWSLLTY